LNASMVLSPSQTRHRSVFLGTRRQVVLCICAYIIVPLQHSRIIHRSGKSRSGGFGGCFGEGFDDEGFNLPDLHLQLWLSCLLTCLLLCCPAHCFSRIFFLRRWLAGWPSCQFHNMAGLSVFSLSVGARIFLLCVWWWRLLYVSHQLDMARRSGSPRSLGFPAWHCAHFLGRHSRSSGLALRSRAHGRGVPGVCVVRFLLGTV
jgi:hypothetical protein